MKWHSVESISQMTTFTKIIVFSNIRVEAEGKCHVLDSLKQHYAESIFQLTSSFMEIGVLSNVCVEIEGKYHIFTSMKQHPIPWLIEFKLKKKKSKRVSCWKHLSTNILIHEDGSIFQYICGNIENVSLFPSSKPHCVEKHLTTNICHEDSSHIKCMCGSIRNVPYA